MSYLVKVRTQIRQIINYHYQNGRFHHFTGKHNNNNTKKNEIIKRSDICENILGMHPNIAQTDKKKSIIITKTL